LVIIIVIIIIIVTMGAGSFPGVKRLGRGVEQPPTSSADFKERMEIYISSPYGTSWPVIR
jgi:hypothetical protein